MLHISQQTIGLDDIGLEPEPRFVDGTVEVLEQAGGNGDSGEFIAIFMGDGQVYLLVLSTFLPLRFQFQQRAVRGLGKAFQTPKHKPAHRPFGPRGPDLQSNHADGRDKPIDDPIEAAHKETGLLDIGV